MEWLGYGIERKGKGMEGGRERYRMASLDLANDPCYSYEPQNLRFFFLFFFLLPYPFLFTEGKLSSPFPLRLPDSQLTQITVSTLSRVYLNSDLTRSSFSLFLFLSTDFPWQHQYTSAQPLPADFSPYLQWWPHQNTDNLSTQLGIGFVSRSEFSGQGC